MQSQDKEVSRKIVVLAWSIWTNVRPRQTSSDAGAQSFRSHTGWDSGVAERNVRRASL